MTDQRRDEPQTNTPVAKRAAIYARSGTDSQSERSVADQVSRCRAHAEREGWSVGEVFVDAATSGTLRKRPGLDALLSRADQFHIVLAEALDRVSRDQRHLSAVRDRLVAVGCRLATVSTTPVAEPQG